MVPNINNRGQSFKGVTAYLLHDIEKIYDANGKHSHTKHLETSERVGFTYTQNLHTDDIQEAARYMAWVDLHREELKSSTAGRKATAGNVYHYSIAWQDGQNPTQEHMKETALKSVERLGLSKHQMYMVEHKDEDHKHMHIVVNLVNPENGKIANLKSDMKRLDRWSNEYEKENGIVCHDRAKKYEAWEQGKQAFEISKTKNERKKIYETLVHESFVISDNAKSFQSALSEYGLTLTQGQKRSFVVVDNQGDYYALPKLLPQGINTKEVKARFSDLDAEALPRTDDIISKNKAAFEQEKERLFDNVGEYKTTRELAEERFKLDRNPLQNMRGRLDEDRAGQERRPDGNNILFSGQDDRSRMVNELQSIRGTRSSGGTQGNESGTERAKREDSSENNRGAQTRNEPLKLLVSGNIVKASDRGNIGTITNVFDDDNYNVLFKNPHTQKTFERKFKREELQLLHDPEKQDKAGVLEKAKGVENTSNNNKEKYRAFQNRLDKKYAEYKEERGIKELKEKVSFATQNLADNSGFWARITFKKRDAKEALGAARLNLDSQLERCKVYLDYLNKNRPDWVQKREQEKYGFVSGSSKQQTDQDKGRTDAQKANAHNDNKLLEEAASSPENAANLQHIVKAKTPAQRGKIAEVQSKAETHKAERAAEKTEVNAKQSKERSTAVKEENETLVFDLPNVSQDFEDTAEQTQEPREWSAEELAVERKRLEEEAYDRALREQQGRQLGHDGYYIDNDEGLDRS